jgi:molecular chaperone GrpE (heat shock protein)
MDDKTLKPIPKREQNTVFARPQQRGGKSNIPSLVEAFDIEILEKKSWGQFLLFVENHYKEFVPRLQESNLNFVKNIQVAIKILNEYNQESWVEILSRIPQIQRVDADELYRHISRSKRLTPQEVYQESQTAIRGLINNAEYGFLDTENRDIGRISQLCDAINYFQNHQSKTYFILAQLEASVPEDAKPLFAASKGFQQMIQAGPNRKLQDFGMALMKHFRITRSAIKDEAASNIVLSMGELERDLRTQISILEQEKSELEYQLQQTRSKARQEALREIAHFLQNGRQPALDQIQQMIRLLESQAEETGEPELSSEQALSVFIILRNLMKILQELGIETYPKSLKSKFEISQVDLAEYAYIEGTPFTNEQEIKTVKCIQQGWRVGETVITPAKVRELTACSES